MNKLILEKTEVLFENITGAVQQEAANDCKVRGGDAVKCAKDQAALIALPYIQQV